MRLYALPRADILLTDFYPRTPVECDDLLNITRQETVLISIHALLWSATLIGLYFLKYPFKFLSTHSCGVRLHGPQLQTQVYRYFYPRTPVECDRFCRFGSWSHSYFYPRTPVECDVTFIKFRLQLQISIHALLWSATRTVVMLSTCFITFLSTHSCGVRPEHMRQDYLEA